MREKADKMAKIGTDDKQDENSLTKMKTIIKVLHRQLLSCVRIRPGDEMAQPIPEARHVISNIRLWG